MRVSSICHWGAEKGGRSATETKENSGHRKLVSRYREHHIQTTIFKLDAKTEGIPKGSVSKNKSKCEVGLSSVIYPTLGFQPTLMERTVQHGLHQGLELRQTSSAGPAQW